MCEIKGLHEASLLLIVPVCGMTKTVPNARKHRSTGKNARSFRFAKKQDTFIQIAIHKTKRFSLTLTLTPLAFNEVDGSQLGQTDCHVEFKNIEPIHVSPDKESTSINIEAVNEATEVEDGYHEQNIDGDSSEQQNSTTEENEEVIATQLGGVTPDQESNEDEEPQSTPDSTQPSTSTFAFTNDQAPQTHMINVLIPEEQQSTPDDTPSTTPNEVNDENLEGQQQQQGPKPQEPPNKKTSKKKKRKTKKE